MTKKAEAVVLSLIEAMRKNGFKCNTPYDIENFMADHANNSHEALFPVVCKSRIGMKIGTSQGRGTIVGFLRNPDTFVIDLDSGGTVKYRCDGE